MKGNHEKQTLEDNKKIFALYNENTIRIYQAYSDKIADEAISLGKFGDHFKMNRMTWIKPSFLWMMYRSGWATKDGQKRILAIDIKREGFNKILENAVMSSFKDDIYLSSEDWKKKLKYSRVRCQWDLDRDIHGNPINRRAIQLGLKGSMLRYYVNNWIVEISDITQYVHKVKEDIRLKNFDKSLLPKEQEYILNESIKKVLGIKI